MVFSTSTMFCFLPAPKDYIRTGERGLLLLKGNNILHIWSYFQTALTVVPRCHANATIRGRETKNVDGTHEAHTWRHSWRPPCHQQGFEEIGSHTLRGHHKGTCFLRLEFSWSRDVLMAHRLGLIWVKMSLFLSRIKGLNLSSSWSHSGKRTKRSICCLPEPQIRGDR